MDDHIKAEDSDFEITVHPAFASRCTVQRNGSEEREIYKQNAPHKLNGKKHPKRHQIRLKGKSNQRDITITLDDPNHSVAQIRVELYSEGRNPEEGSGGDTDTVFTIQNDAITCPPICRD